MKIDDGTSKGIGNGSLESKSLAESKKSNGAQTKEHLGLVNETDSQASDSRFDQQVGAESHRGFTERDNI